MLGYQHYWTRQQRHRYVIKSEMSESKASFVKLLDNSPYLNKNDNVRSRWGAVPGSKNLKQKTRYKQILTGNSNDRHNLRQNAISHLNRTRLE